LTSGHSAGINPANAVICVGVLEGRVTELMFNKASLDMRRIVEIEGSTSALKHKAVTVAPTQKMKTQGGPFIPQVVVTGRLDG